MKRLFHVVLEDAFGAARERGDVEWRPSSLASEGFVHLSYAEQVPGTLATHYREHARVLLLELELSDRAELRDEISRGGALFPHLHRALRLDEVARVHVLERPAGGWERVSVPPR
ncbi:MAG: DUF952 domain-containing protein [Planctomycetota bacterium]